MATASIIIKMIHFQMWNVKEWREGFLFGRKVAKIKITDSPEGRDSNPYNEETNFYANECWDAGYIMGLANYKFQIK